MLLESIGPIQEVVKLQEEEEEEKDKEYLEHEILLIVFIRGANIIYKTKAKNHNHENMQKKNKLVKKLKKKFVCWTKMEQGFYQAHKLKNLHQTEQIY